MSPAHLNTKKCKQPNYIKNTQITGSKTIIIATLEKNMMNAHCRRIKDPLEESVILPSVEFKRIESMSQVPTTEEAEAQREALQKKKEEEKVEIMTKH